MQRIFWGEKFAQQCTEHIDRFRTNFYLAFFYEIGYDIERIKL